MKKGRVLIVETDGPKVLVAPRFREPAYLEPVEGVAWAFCPPLGVPNIDPKDYEELARIRDEFQPDLVFFNTLRTLHQMKDVESHVPTLIYSWGRKMFPGCTLLFVHHPKKSPPANMDVPEDEMFSGSNAWRNDAQVALHLQKHESRKRRFYIGKDGKEMSKASKELYSTVRIRHTKSQVSPLFNPLPLKLESDGTNWRCPLFEELSVVKGIWENGQESLTKGGSKHSLDLEIGEALKEMGVAHSPATARRRRDLVERGVFPNTPFWLGMTRHEEEPGEEEDSDDEEA